MVNPGETYGLAHVNYTVSPTAVIGTQDTISINSINVGTSLSDDNGNLVPFTAVNGTVGHGHRHPRALGADPGCHGGVDRPRGAGMAPAADRLVGLDDEIWRVRNECPSLLRAAGTFNARAAKAVLDTWTEDPDRQPAGRMTARLQPTRHGPGSHHPGQDPRPGPRPPPSRALPPRWRPLARRSRGSTVLSACRVRNDDDPVSLKSREHDHLRRSTIIRGGYRG